MKLFAPLAASLFLLLVSCTNDQNAMRKRLDDTRWNIDAYHEQYGAVKIDYTNAGYLEFSKNQNGTRHLIVNGDTTLNDFTWSLGVESISILEGTENRTFKVLTNEDDKQVWEYSQDGDIIRYTLSK